MLRRPLAVLFGLTVGDYLLWTWSLSGSLSGERDALALVSGLTLPPLTIACLWLLALSVARTVARSTGRPRVRSRAERAAANADRQGQNRRSGPAPGLTHEDGPVPTTASAAPSAQSSEKLAA